MKKPECIIHFSNYLMEQEDTTRTNTLSSDTLTAWFQLAGLPTGRQSCQASHTSSSTSPNPAGFDEETWPGCEPCDTENMQQGAQAACQESSSFACHDPSGGGRPGVCGPRKAPWSLCEQPRQAAITEGWRQLPGCWAKVQWLRMCLWKSLSHD